MARTDVSRAVHRAVSSIPVPSPPADLLQRGRSRQRRHFATIILTMAAATATVYSVTSLVIATHGQSEGNAADAAQAEWADLGVPYATADSVIYHGVSTPRPSTLTSLASTHDSALIVSGGGGAGRVIELRRDGSTSEVGANVLGIAIADPTGDLATWTEQTDDDAVRVVAYDTSDGQIISTTTGGLSLRPFAVGEGTIVLNDGRRSLEWTPDVGSPQPIGGLSEDELVTDVTDGYFFVHDFQPRGAFLVPTDGSEVVALQGASFGTFDFTGTHIAVTEPIDGELSTRIYDMQSRTFIDLQVPGRIDSSRWAPGGQLVVRTGLPADGIRNPESPATYYACDASTGQCTPVEEAEPAGGETSDGVEASAWGQLFSMTG